MEHGSEGNKLSAPQQISRIFAMIMVVLYLGLGTTIIIKAPQIKSNIPLFQDTPLGYLRAFGGFMILYGLFRGYNTYRQYFTGSESDSDQPE